MQSLLAFIGFGGPMELIIVLVIILLLFGNRLPGLMRSMGRSIVEFKKGVHEVEDKSDGKQESEEGEKSKQSTT